MSYRIRLLGLVTAVVLCTGPELFACGDKFLVSGGVPDTHGGLRAGSVTGDPFPFPGELNTPARFQERDRILRVKYWQVAAGVAYSAGPVDLFASFTKYVWGRDAHNGRVYGLGATWYFDLAD